MKIRGWVKQEKMGKPHEQHNTKQNIQFNGAASTRDKEAAKYFTSQEFLDKAKEFFMQAIVKNGASSICFRTDFTAKSQDQVHIDQTLLKLKAEFPEINHLRITGGDITLDTKPNTFLRRLSAAATGVAHATPPGK